MRSITISDLCELTGYSRDQMRGLLAELPRFAQRRTEARVAREYSNHDVVLVSVLCRLETVYGLKRSVVSALCESIAATLTVPRKVSKDACLILRVHGSACEYVDAAPQIDDGLVVALAPVFLAIDSYLLPNPLAQRDVGLSATVTLPKPSNAAGAPSQMQAPENKTLGYRRGRSSHG